MLLSKMWLNEKQATTTRYGKVIRVGWNGGRELALTHYFRDPLTEGATKKLRRSFDIKSALGPNKTHIKENNVTDWFVQNFSRNF